MRRTCIAALALLVAAVAAAPAAAKVEPGPKGAAFYTPPKHLKGKHGALVWARKHSGRDALAGASRNELLLYRSTGLDGKKIVVSGSLALPKGKAPKGGWPLISYAHGTTGAADSCAPSRGYDAGKLTSYAYPLLRRWLNAGYAVVRTDYEGLGTPGVHHYLHGLSEGRSVLDAVRAARAFAPRKLANRVIIAGHSQGGHAALFAASLAPTWTPELRVRGTVAFAPASHLATQFEATLAVGTPGGGLGAIVGLGLRAIDLEDPSLGVAGLLTPQSAALYPQTETVCYDALSADTSFGALPLNQILRSDAVLDPLLAVVALSDPEHLAIKTPVRIEQGEADATVFRLFTDQLVGDYTHAGTKVTYVTYPGVSHGGVVDTAAKDATNYIRTRLK
jgi:pimeloyl-ACP methyl ester carboxylesterase